MFDDNSKKLSDGQKVLSSTYYYLLDYNDRTERKVMQALFDKDTLAHLTLSEYMRLFNLATTRDTVDMIEKMNS